MDVAKQIEYWRASGRNDLEAAEDVIIKVKREIHGLFYTHLSIEKILKAHVVKVTKDFPPKIHALASLLNRTDINLDVEQHKLLGKLMKFHLEGRYAEDFPKPIPNEEAIAIYKEAKQLFEWLEKKL